MPPKAEYWKYFNVVGVVAYCLIADLSASQVGAEIGNTLDCLSYTKEEKEEHDSTE